MHKSLSWSWVLSLSASSSWRLDAPSPSHDQASRSSLPQACTLFVSSSLYEFAHSVGYCRWALSHKYRGCQLDMVLLHSFRTEVVAKNWRKKSLSASPFTLSSLDNSKPNFRSFIVSLLPQT
ncbi:hypothetical protein PoB_000472700 [Plakobranchus ocellatus]|uniref:Secreted protein n=1 Tax=Plakobranchus ocellatus TaxID=259542 RepID=A0AAV3Y6Z1_9GAST|nr:hypothetical protein PoB_000472700 [Plakobranchus ocellatus]